MKLRNIYLKLIFWEILDNTTVVNPESEDRFCNIVDSVQSTRDINVIMTQESEKSWRQWNLK